MMMAGRAAELGARVLLIERNKSLGKKLKITGGGRCNITNAIFDVRAFLDHFPQSKQFLYSPFSKFSAKDTFTFFEGKGLPLIVEARERVFPKSQKAEDVFNVLEKYMRNNRVSVKTRTRIVSFEKEGKEIISVHTQDGGRLFARNFALATGGVAAPGTGSTGDGFNMLERLNHKVIQPNPNIVPLKVRESWVHDLSGTTLSFMTIRFLQNGKVKLKKTGKILFTHFGISGPLILNSAYEVKQLLGKGRVIASVDMFPDTEENDLDHRIQNLFEKNKNKTMKNVLPEMLQKNMSKEILALPDINLTNAKVHSITKEERKRLVKKLKNLTFEITGTMGFERAIITDGGISLNEVEFKNMSSRLYPNLYLLGDILNINRPSGGFSLQLCWTTGWVAGTDVGEKTSKYTIA